MKSEYKLQKRELKKQKQVEDVISLFVSHPVNLTYLQVYKKMMSHINGVGFVNRYTMVSRSDEFGIPLESTHYCDSGRRIISGYEFDLTSHNGKSITVTMQGINFYGEASCTISYLLAKLKELIKQEFKSKMENKL